ncbi:hypothetical protein B0T25DRAFT_519592 [Lasiosphaeria hispida]|uniref:Uncharacterized protein n=1 Tax=Lasiosphaeria hispida TaxID=260671 RepID=A0AAJ0MC77_9PEZI|nr:hypothetical protein B0T25DRAFT_519592 [Lasiosphaeria hispida]
MDTSTSKMENITTTADVPFAPFLAGLAAWALLRLVLEALVRYLNPEFFEDLKLDIRKRYDLYFGVWLGTIFKIVSLISCSAAVLTTPAETDIAGLARPLNTAEQWCWGCRAVIFVQEMPHIQSIPELLVHHMLSIAAMLGILAWRLPRRQLYLLWATLLSEFVTNARRLLKMHGRMGPRAARWFSLAMAVMIVGFRMTGLVVAILWSFRSGTSGLALFVNVGAMVIYMTYMVKMAAWELERAGVLAFDMVKPAALVVAEKWRISLFGVILGAGFLATEVSALFVYQASQGGVNSAVEVHSIVWAFLQAAAAGLFGAYVTAPIMKVFVVSGGPEGGKNYPKLCLPGGLLAASATLCYSPTIPSSIDRAHFLASVVVSLPLLDALGHVGCYFAGIEGFARGEKRPVVAPGLPGLKTPSPRKLKKRSRSIAQSMATPILLGEQPSPAPTAEHRFLALPLIASVWSGLLYIVVLTCYRAGLDLYQAAAFTLAVRSVISHYIGHLRGDFILRTMRLPGSKTDATWVSFVQLLFVSVAVTYCHLADYTKLPITPSSGFRWDFYISLPVLLVAWGTDLLSVVVEEEKSIMEGGRSNPSPGAKMWQENRGKIIGGTAGLAMCLAMVAGSYLGAMPPELTVEQAKSMARPVSVFWGAVASWQFALPTVCAAVLPVLVVQFVG